MKSRSKIFAVMALPLLVIGGLGQGCYYKEAPPDTRNDAQKAEAKWFNAKARELQGDFDKLTPEEKQRAITFSRNSESEARTGFGFAAKGPAQ